MDGARFERWRASTAQAGFREVWESSRQHYAPRFRAEIDRIVAEAGN